VKARHRPERTCVACREARDQRELVRLAYGDEGLIVDERRRAPGRGAYLCRRGACWERARVTSQAKGGGPLGHALRVTINADDRAVLEAYERGLIDDAGGPGRVTRPEVAAASRGESGTA